MVSRGIGNHVGGRNKVETKWFSEEESDSRTEINRFWESGIYWLDENS